MIKTWAVILNGLIVNTVRASDSDIKDPAYIWVDLSQYNPQPGIGWTTSDNINFSQPLGD
jgi:hypothetical protein